MVMLPGALRIMAAIVVLVVPGLVVARLVRLRPLAATGFAAPCSLAVITVSAEAATAVRVPWSPLIPLVVTLLGALLLIVLRRPRTSIPRHGRAPRRVSMHDLHGALGRARRQLRHDPLSFFATRAGERAALAGGLIVGGSIMAARLWSMMGSLRSVTQTYDGIYHLNAVRRILDLRSASAWTAGSLTTAPGTANFYPSAWHQTVSLVAQLTGGDIVGATNALLLVVCAGIWPVGLALLVRTCTSAGSLGLFATGVLSSAAFAFPFVPASFGVLFPFVLSMTLVPVGLTVLLQLLRWGAPGRSGSTLHPAQALVLVVPVSLAVVASHPQGLSALLVLGLPIIVWAVCVRASRRRIDGTAPLLATLAAAALAFTMAITAWSHLRVGRGSAGWLPTATPLEAIGATLSLGAQGGAPTWSLAVVVVGAATATILWSRSGWLVASWLWAVPLAVAALSMQDLDYRYALTGTWYSDNNRVLAVPIVVAVPILAVGLDTVARELRSRGVLPRAHLGPLAAVCTVLAVLAVGALSPSSRASYRDFAPWWQHHGLLSDDELELLHDLPDLVKPGDVVAVDPWDGGALAYAISDRDVIARFPVGYRSDEAELLGERLHDIQRDPLVCDAAAGLGVRYVLDFGSRELWDMTGHSPGIDLVGEEPAASYPVARRGDAALLRLRPCVRSDGAIWV